MAAYAALVSLARVIDQILPHDQDYTFLCAKEQMESLHKKTICLQEFLEYISTRSLSLKVDVVESRIRDVAHQLEDIIESIICKLLDQGFTFRRVAKTFSRRLGSNNGCLGGSIGVATSYSSPTVTQLSAVFCSCIEEIDILLEEATKTKNIPVNKYASGILDSSTTSSSKETPSNTKDTKVGLDNDLIQILGRITGQGSKLQIVPITGMGGIGKTTLARAVYEDSRMLQHFDVRSWVTISQEYDIQKVLSELLHTGQQTEKPDCSLIEQVYKYLKSRRFLIVLDDMWHEKAWDGVMNALPDDNNGSRIILTTRQLGVATYVGSLSHVHQMKLLNKNQSWIMLRRKVCGKKSCPKEFESIGRTISKNCKGLPLAVVVIAGLLKCNKTIDYWEEVAENTKGAAAASDYEHLFGILSLSYNGLPPHLKACFMYMGSFPEDYEIRTKELVMLWTAEGFLRPNKSITMEDVAEECMEELARRSLALVRERRYNGKIKTCIIHDVLREVSIRKAREEKFLRHHSAFAIQKSIKNRRKVSFYNNDLLNFQHDTYHAPVHSFQYTYPASSQWKIIHVIKSLGVLIRNCSMLTAVCELTRLRYLHLRYHPSIMENDLLIRVPKSISKLINLETFICTSNPYHFTTTLILPLEIWKLPRLRHLVLTCDNNLRFPEASQGYPVLESFQTLSVLRNANFTKSVIEKIPNIKKLKLEYTRNVTKTGKQPLSVNNLQHLCQLEELSIVCLSYDVLIPAVEFGFPRKLKELSLKGTKFSVENMSLIGLLPNLEVLKLKDNSIAGICNSEWKTVWEPLEGEFLKLKNLTMMQLHIYEWRAESVHFPCLEELVIVSCRLEEVPESIGEIDTLQKLIMKDCDRANESVLKILENQRDMGNDLLEVLIFDWSGKRIISSS